MKIVCISDTHQRHKEITIPKGDVLVFTGDFGNGGLSQMSSFARWFSKQDFKYKILIAGNHDWCLQNDKTKSLEILKKHNIIYLEDSGVNIDGVNFWGSPYSKKFFDWAFMKSTEDLKKHWELIPDNTNVLLTHSPPFEILDTTYRQCNAGCPNLKNKVLSLPNLKLHVFGHIHESYGIKKIKDTVFINASIWDHGNWCTNKPVEITV